MIPSLAEQLSPLKCGDHLCLICDTFEEQMAAIVPYVKAGLARGERCVYLAGEGASDQVLAALAGGGVDVRRETERGSFLMLSNPDVRLKGGRFDPQATTAFLRGALTEALSAGFSALRVTVDWTRGLGTDVVVDRIIEYEATLNASVFAPGSSMLGLCQYDRHRSPPEVIEGVLRTHPVAILGDLVCPNLYYEPPEVALGNTLASARMEWMITQLKRARKTSQDLGDTNALLGDHMAVQRESERSLGVLLSNLPGLAYRCRNDRDWTMEFVSQGCLALTGYQPADLVGNSRISFGQLIHPDDRQGVWDSVQATIENREPYQLTYRIITQSGEERWVWGHGCGIFSADGALVALEGFITDITDRKQAEVALHKVNRALRTLSEFDQLLVRAPDETALLDNVCRIAVEFGGYRMAWVGIAQHDEAKTVKPVAWAGHEEGYLEHARISWADDEHGGGATGRAIRTGNVCIIKDVQQEPAASPWASEMARLGYTSSMALPLIGPGGTFGALNLYATDSNAFDEEEVRLLTELATDLAYGLSALRTENERRQAVDALRDTLQQLRRTIDGTIRAMAATSELRDPYTAGHQKRTARLAVAIAREMGLPEDEVDSIRMAGEIHDIGKISVPAEISSKPGRLSELEFSLIKGHAQTGYEILKGIEFPRPIAGMVLQHHERLDGSGYPFGLTAVDIIPGARILAVADVVEAMASHRPYRPARGLDDALREISQHRGTLYDPEVVDACLRVLADGSFNFE